jgi:hypothetical protein
MGIRNFSESAGAPAYSVVSHPGIETTEEQSEHSKFAIVALGELFLFSVCLSPFLLLF